MTNLAGHLDRIAVIALLKSWATIFSVAAFGLHFFKNQ